MMDYIGKLDEYFLTASIKSTDVYRLKQFSGDCLRIFWNDKEDTILIVDGVEYVLAQNQILFLTDMHDIGISKINEINLIKFNRAFYDSDYYNNEIGCNGVLFYAHANIPIIILEKESLAKFKLLWTVLKSEMESKDSLQGQMLLMLLKRFLILSTRIYKEQNKNIVLPTKTLDTIREYNFLVEINFKTKHTVAEYALLMNKPAKSLANLFARHTQTTPLKTIQDRVHVEAKRQLIFTQKIIKEIAFELGFNDMQSFSRFFKNKQGVYPKEFRNLYK